MKATATGLLCLGVAVALSAGCRRDVTVPEQVVETVAPAAEDQGEVELGFPVIREVKPTLPVVDLDNAQKKVILDELRCADVKKGEIWFAVLIYNSHEHRDLRDIHLYLRSEVSNARFRSGKALFMWGILYSFRERRSMRLFDGDTAAIELSGPPLHDYVQVSFEDGDFGDENGLPSPGNLPFRKNPDLSMEEMVEVVRAARGLAFGRTSIHSIEKTAADTYEVRSAVCSQSMACRGEVAVIRKENGTWKLVSKSDWLS
jgi:hypothetical protein